jgi:hypothetical protein
MALIGFGLMWAQRYTPGWADFVLSRGAGLVFLGGGALGVSGTVGGWIRDLFAWSFEQLNALSSWALGFGAAPVAAFAVCILWVLGMVPGKLFKWDPPDWLIYAGLLLPIVAAAVPGGTGEGFRELFASLGQQTNELVGGWLR